MFHKNNYSVLLVVLLFLLCLNSCNSRQITVKKEPFNTGVDDVQKCQLFVYGENKTEKISPNILKIDKEQHYAAIPVLSVLRQMGCNVDWRDENTAKISYNDRIFILDTSFGDNKDTILYDKSNSPHTESGYYVVQNYLMIPPGSNYYTLGINKVGEEIVTDSVRLGYFFREVFNSSFIIDGQKNSVSIQFIANMN